MRAKRAHAIFETGAEQGTNSSPIHITHVNDKQPCHVQKYNSLLDWTTPAACACTPPAANCSCHRASANSSKFPAECVTSQTPTCPAIISLCILQILSKRWASTLPRLTGTAVQPQREGGYLVGVLCSVSRCLFAITIWRKSIQ